MSIKDPTPKHVKKAFDDDPTLQYMQVICPDDKQSEKDLNKEIFLDEMKPKRLSSISKATGRAYTAPASRLLVFKFDGSAGAFRQVSYDSMEEDANGKVLCLLNRKSVGYNSSTFVRMPVLSSKKELDLTALRALMVRYPKISFYGVDQDTDKDRVEEEFGDFKKLDEFIDEKVLNNTSMNYVEIKFAQEHHYHVDNTMLKHLPKMQKLVEDPKSLFLTRLELHEKLRKMGGDDKGLLDIYESVKGFITDTDLKKFVKANPEWDIERINTEYTTKYPLLGALNIYQMDKVVDHLARYVNMVDKI